MEDSFTYVNRLYEEAKLKHIKNEVLGDLRNELKTLIENHFKESCHETSSQPKENDDDAIALLKEEIKYLRVNLLKKKVISNLIGSCKSSSGSLKHIFYFRFTSAVLQHKHTVSNRVKKIGTNAGELKSKAKLDKQFKFKLRNIY